MGKGDAASTKFEPPEWTSDRFPGAMNALDQLVQSPYQQYQGMRVSPVNAQQQTAGQLAMDRMLNGDPQMNAARGSLMNISQGGAANPFMNDSWLNKNISDTANDMAGAQAITNSGNAGLAARSGAYGGSAHLQAQDMANSSLLKNVGQMGSQARSADLGRKGQLWQQDVGNVMGASGMSLPFAQQDHADIAGGMNYGNFLQGQGQRLLDDSYSVFNEQKDHPFKMFDYLMSGLAKGSGQYGTNYQSQPGQSTGGLLGGLGLTAASFM